MTPEKLAELVQKIDVAEGMIVDLLAEQVADPAPAREEDIARLLRAVKIGRELLNANRPAE